MNIGAVAERVRIEPRLLGRSIARCMTAVLGSAYSRRVARAIDPVVLRAVKLSRVPGVTIAEASKRFGVAVSAVQRARRAAGAATTLSLAELALAALTDNGTRAAGTLDDLPRIASWLDYVNHDGSTVDDIRRLLATLPEVLVIEGERWRLVAAWP